MPHLNVTERKCKTDEPAPVKKRLFTVAEFMSAYGIGRTRTYGEIKAKRLIVRRLGGRTYVAEDDAEAWLAALPVHRPSQLKEAA